MQDWQHFAEFGFALGFQYPQTTPQGHTVERSTSQGDNSVRVHFTSRDSHELYFELTKYTDLSPQVEYEHHKGSLEKKLNQFRISDLKEIRWLSQPAYEYSFQWQQGTRTVILIETDHAMYRILYDPYSPLNVQILSTVQWTY